MTRSSSCLIARLEALRSLLQETLQAQDPDPRHWQDDWRADHAGRLAAHRARAEALRAEAPPDDPLSALSRRCGLTPLDEELLLLALAPEIDRTLGRALSQLKRTYGQARADVDLALSLLAGELPARLEALSRLSPEAPLMRWGLLTLQEGRGEAGPMARELVAPARVQHELLGLGQEAQVGAWSVTSPAHPWGEVLLPEEDEQRLEALLGAGTRLGGAHRLVLLLAGASGTGKTALAHAIAARLGKRLLVVDALALSARVADLGRALDEIATEARLGDAVLFFDDCELLFGSRLQGNRALPTLLNLLDEATGPVILATHLEELLDPAVGRRVLLRVGLGFPAPRQRLTLWRRALPTDLDHGEDLDLDFIAEKYEFTGGQIQQAAAMAVAWAATRAEATLALCAEDVDRAARAQLRHHLSQLAVRQVTHLTLDDVVLEDELMRTLRSIIAAVRNRRRIFEDWGFGQRLTTGKGLSMLFKGESGTGKTLSAEVLASELAMPIYRVAIPRIVSKYIGETEQNLERAFREAQVAQAILLFDEADAIFTKRVDVGNATDRYSNMEVNLLLQELERFEGVVILTTNLEAAIDDAFERRLNYKLDFPFPTAGLRRRIWQRHLPPQAPVELSDDELDYLSEHFELSGGAIKNVVVRAAYAAAEGDRAIDVELLETAAVQEYREMGKLISV